MICRKAGWCGGHSCSVTGDKFPNLPEPQFLDLKNGDNSTHPSLTLQASFKFRRTPMTQESPGSRPCGLAQPPPSPEGTRQDPRLARPPAPGSTGRRRLRNQRAGGGCTTDRPSPAPVLPASHSPWSCVLACLLVDSRVCLRTPRSLSQPPRAACRPQRSPALPPPRTCRCHIVENVTPRAAPAPGAPHWPR